MNTVVRVMDFVGGEERDISNMNLISMTNQFIHDFRRPCIKIVKFDLTIFSHHNLLDKAINNNTINLIKLQCFISHAFEMACINFGVEHERIPPRTPNMNAHIESFHRLLQDECLSRYDFQNYSEAYSVVTSYIDYYNERRIHSSIGDRSPSEFYNLIKHEKLRIKEFACNEMVRLTD